MDAELQLLVDESQKVAKGRYALWNAELYGELCETAASRLWDGVQGRKDAAKVMEAYLTLSSEAVARGYLRGLENGVSRDSLLAHGLTSLIPDHCGGLEASETLPLLATVWNLCEGLLAEPRWVDRYVVARAGELDDPNELATFLVRVLDPVLRPTEPVSWNGPFRLSILQTRHVDEDFLPGEMFLGGPRVLCVADRRRDVCLGVLLQKSGKSEVLGQFSRMERLDEPAPSVKIDWQANRAIVGQHEAPLPHLHTVHQQVIAQAGFAVASAVDSQRLWIVESS